ncbi:ankyrin repeat domain-containing protein [Candidatus Cardinium hertigii]|uniref:ankyrin repeat domain-containing protein n=1 Tax=Candidatus Cardinium hertigii TaxID=247481 RepID=UPI003D7C91AD
MSLKLFLSSIILGLSIIPSVKANPSSLPVVSAKEFWQAIHERNPAALEGKQIPPKYFKQCKKKNTPLNQAILNEDIAMVRLLIAKGADVNHPDKEKDTPLHAAVMAADKAILELLLKCPVALDSQDKNSRTPLLLAIQNNQYDLVVQLVKKGANKEKKGIVKYNEQYSYRTPLELAIASSPNIAAYLIEQGVKLDEKGAQGNYPIAEAVWHKREVLVDKMLAQGVPLFYPEAVGFTVLHAAACHEPDYLKRYLNLAPAGKQNQQDEEGNTPLHYAASVAGPDNIALLLEKGANPFILNRLGQQPLNCVVNHPNTTHQLAIASLLIAQGADVNAMDHQFTLLGNAVLQGKLELIKLLLEHKANVEQLPTNPLYFKRSVSDKLFSRTVKVINTQTTLLHLAIVKGQTAIAQFLLAHHPAFVNQKDAFGCTPLHYAAAFDNVAIAHDLLAHGARLDIRERTEGYTPIQFAKEMSFVVKNGEEKICYSGNRVTRLLEKWQKEQKAKAKAEKIKQKNEKKKAKK